MEFKSSAIASPVEGVVMCVVGLLQVTIASNLPSRYGLLETTDFAQRKPTKSFAPSGG
jgi:hypothetical protein